MEKRRGGNHEAMYFYKQKFKIMPKWAMDKSNRNNTSS